MGRAWVAMRRCTDDADPTATATPTCHVPRRHTRRWLSWPWHWLALAKYDKRQQRKGPVMINHYV